MCRNLLYKLLENTSTKIINKYKTISTDIIEKNMEKVTLSGRLSSLVRPVNYKLSLEPDMKTGTFKGDVNITVDVKQEKKYINLHTKFHNIGDVKVFKGEEEIPVSKYLEVKQVEQLLIHFENAISSGTYQIHVQFDGDLTHNIVGLYLSRLDKDSTMVASKFQPTYARQAFPCFDEPEYKATFDITLVKPVDYIALSNMHEMSKKSINNNNKSEAVTFATSVPMSTYLACFVICQFDNKEVQVNSHGIGENFMLRAFAQKKELHKIDFALDIGRRATEFYIKYYNVPFPLSKLDMIAIPDYISGATEHWGLITYRETSFLIDTAASSVQNQISVANTIAHELAHMWFGNLVTLKWWDDLWLNEGFASYMQIKCLNSIEPSWNMYDKLQTTTLHGVLVTDAKLSSHPIVQTAESPDEITALFDSISYNKGASLLRMLEGFIGEENFRQGISEYLEKFKYNSTVTQDLLTVLEPHFKLKYPGLDLKYIMDTWTKQMGYPVVTVERVGEECRLSQSRFLLDPEAKNTVTSPYNYLWYVPITYKTNLRTSKATTWLSDKMDGVHGPSNHNIDLSEGEKWLKLNNDQVNYYRVNYSEDLWRALIDELKQGGSRLTVADRANLLDDVFALAEAKLVSYDLALDLSTYLQTENNYAPWQTAARIFGDLKKKISNPVTVDNLKKYVQNLIKPLYEKQSFNSTDGDVGQRLLRWRILSLATSMGLPDAESKAKDLLMRWIHSTDKAHTIEPDLRKFVYAYGMKGATINEWEKLWEKYLKVDDVQERTNLQYALAAPIDTEILRRYLRLAWDEKYVRSQDYLNVLQYISDNPSGTALVWDEVRSIWPQLVTRYSLNSRYLGNMIPGITAKFNSELKLHEMEVFFETYPEAGAGETARRRAIETVQNNIKWVQEKEGLVTTWLHNYNSKYLNGNKVES